jgi:myo-inositol-1(or 4)-monophosphatase
LDIAKEAIWIIKKAEFYYEEIRVAYKSDWSPCTQFDVQVEQFVRDEFLKRYPNMNFCGEELWWTLDDKLTCVIDPIDGTNSFISHGHSHAFVLSLHEYWKMLVAIVANPSTGEIFFTKGSGQTRLLQVLFGTHQDLERTLPIQRSKDNQNILLNIQNSRRQEVDSILLAASDPQIRLKRVVSWSSALHIAETSKGFYTYVCDYRWRPATPYDLMDSVRILRNAGWYIVDMDWKDVGKVWYDGIFVAGISKTSVNKIISILKNR